ncbi:MAG TPA: acetyltransferase [Bryobacteraceae bacterium]|jgi:hypothetical protein
MFVPHTGRVSIAAGWALLALALAACPSRAQQLRKDAIRVTPQDEAVLSASGQKKELDCGVAVIKPQMQFDLRFHPGYTATVGLKSIAGEGDMLRTVLRVTPLDPSGPPVVLTGELPVPPLSTETGGETELPVEYTVGPGRYRVDWLMRDRRNRVCSKHWTLEAELDERLEGVPLSLRPGAVDAASDDAFRELANAPAREHGRLRVKVLINFSGERESNSAADGRDVRGVVSILRAVARDPLFGRFSIVAFSMKDRQVFYRQPESPEIDFPALGNAVKKLKFGTVDYDVLREHDGGANFLATVLTEQIGAGQPAPDAVIVISPNVMLDKKVASERLARAGASPCPVFYLNYNPDPLRNPWRGAISAALKAYRAVEYTIAAPRDLASALGNMANSLRARR